MSLTECKYENLNLIGKIWIKFGSRLGIIYINELEDGIIEINNLTNLNLTLKIFGSISEEKLTTILLFQQIFGCFIALAVRYQLSDVLYAE